LVQAVSLERRQKMDNATITRIAAGIVFAILLIVLIQRRRNRVR
jgi:hypothetical protein